MKETAGRERLGLQDGDKIRELRKSAGYSTATAFAQRLGIKPNSLINIERGNKAASLAMLLRIASELDTSVDDLLREAA
jgi:transcriptional regulator with XRE-family HTH domain